MNQNVSIFETSQALVSSFTSFFFKKANHRIQENKTFTVALSGGSTPGEFFRFLGEHHKSASEWKQTHLFWGDERMVPSESDESNFGIAKNLFLDKIQISKENIHPIRGENVTENEAARYSCEIVSYVHEDGSLPSFDLIMLGLGEDGHTASIFPNQLDLMYSGRVCEIAIHPKTGQERITLSGKTINNARNIAFLVTGEAKAKVIEEIFNKKGDFEKYPASHINPESGNLYWFLDKEAAHYLGAHYE